MRRLTYLIGISLISVSLTFLDNTEAAERILIAHDNLATLKGVWNGNRILRFTTHQAKVDLELYNDVEPLQGKCTFRDIRGKEVEAFHSAPRAIVDIHFKNAHMNDKGTLLIIEGETSIELSLYSEGKRLKLEGSYQCGNAGGTIVLYKRPK